MLAVHGKHRPRKPLSSIRQDDHRDIPSATHLTGPVPGPVACARPPRRAGANVLLVDVKVDPRIQLMMKAILGSKCTLGKKGFCGARCDKRCRSSGWGWEVWATTTCGPCCCCSCSCICCCCGTVVTKSSSSSRWRPWPNHDTLRGTSQHRRNSQQQCGEGERVAVVACVVEWDAMGVVVCLLHARVARMIHVLFQVCRLPLRRQDRGSSGSGHWIGCVGGGGDGDGGLEATRCDGQWSCS